jgi:hypothetical protein
VCASHDFNKWNYNHTELPETAEYFHQRFRIRPLSVFSFDCRSNLLKAETGIETAQRVMIP